MFRQSAEINIRLIAKMLVVNGHADLAYRLSLISIDLVRDEELYIDLVAFLQKREIKVWKMSTARIKFFLRCGFKINTRTLEHAVSKGNSKLLQLCIDTKQNLNCVWYDKTTPLIYAIDTYTGSLKIIKLLIYNGADVNYHPSKCQPPLWRANWHGLTDVADLLLENGADYFTTFGPAANAYNMYYYYYN